ncbi:MAG TPA: FHA domain-containing protein, partial [Ktedonobacteraceae bacterium]|nr:FHA domain-containing protein [Ktedonobacteraceae bacterium]
RGTFKELKRMNGVFTGLLEEQNRYNLDREDAEETIVRSIYAPTTPLPRISLTNPRIPALTTDTLPLIPAIASINGAAAIVTKGHIYSQNSQALTEYQIGHEQNGTRKRDTTQDSSHRPIKAHILIEMDNQIIGEYRLNKVLFTIGRLPSSDIHIPSQRVSRFHALIRWKYGAWIIEDAESLNGLTCQGQRIDQLALLHGDRILFDPTIVLRYEEI